MKLEDSIRQAQAAVATMLPMDVRSPKLVTYAFEGSKCRSSNTGSHLKASHRGGFHLRVNVGAADSGRVQSVSRISCKRRQPQWMGVLYESRIQVGIQSICKALADCKVTDTMFYYTSPMCTAMPF